MVTERQVEYARKIRAHILKSLAERRDQAAAAGATEIVEKINSALRWYEEREAERFPIFYIENLKMTLSSDPKMAASDAYNVYRTRQELAQDRANVDALLEQFKQNNDALIREKLENILHNERDASLRKRIYDALYR
jgi:hypothetical protein